MDEGQSAKTADRPEFKNLISYCVTKSKKIEVVVVSRLDRFSRNPSDHFAVRVLLRKSGISLRSVMEQIDETAPGQLMEGMFAIVAYHDNLVRGERTVTGMKAALEKGRWTWQAPVRER